MHRFHTTRGSVITQTSMPSTTKVDALLARHKAALQYLYARINYERIPKLPYHDRCFKLERMQELVDRLGNPERAMRTVHVAGTKGKGSTSAMIGCILRASGIRTGVFSSPHLDRVEERMTVDGVECPAEDLVELVETLMPIIEAMDRDRAATGEQPAGPTYFEIITALALLHFVRCGVDTAVLEVGLGGRLDSTNVCLPEVAVITSISLDHTQQLGNTVELIAAEKAGIVKPGVPLVSGVTAPGPREVIRSICRQRGSRLIELGTDFDVEYRAPRGLADRDSRGEIDFEDRSGEPVRLRSLPLGMVGRHQAVNAAVALAAIGQLRRMGHAILDEQILSGLAAARCPARIEVVGRRPTVIIDGAHNVASIEALIAAIEQSFSARKKILVFATTQDKDIAGMMRLVLPFFDEIILTRYRLNPRAVPPKELAAIAARLTGRACRVCSKPVDAWNAARASAGPEDLVCVAGSFFLASELRRICTSPT